MGRKEYLERQKIEKARKFKQSERWRAENVILEAIDRLTEAGDQDPEYLMKLIKRITYQYWESD